MRYPASFQIENIGLIGIEEAAMIVGESPREFNESVKAGEMSIKPIVRKEKTFFRRGSFWSWWEKCIMDNDGSWSDVKQPAICL